MKSKLLKHNKFREDNGNITEIKLWEVTKSKDKPHGYKYSLVYIVEGKRIIGYDNAKGKGDHRHYRKHEDSYNFTTVWQLIADFFKDVEKYKKEVNKYEG